MLRLLGWLLVIWLALSLLGAFLAVLKGLVWLAVIGVLLAGAAAALGWTKRDRTELPRGW
ncbi:hypothetical protein [Blastococcus sp. SYSU DS0617]